MTEMSRPSTPKESVALWLFKIITGPIILIILTIHFLVNHLLAPNGLLTYAEVIAYYKNPIVPIMEIAFVCFAVTHSLIGLRGILLDLNPSQRILRFCDWLLLLLGSTAILYGIWLALTIASA
jgi:succinate dehydrogenase / fumarate reductase membrane anchor subunit